MRMIKPLLTAASVLLLAACSSHPITAFIPAPQACLRPDQVPLPPADHYSGTLGLAPAHRVKALLVEREEARTYQQQAHDLLVACATATATATSAEQNNHSALFSGSIF